ncbi:YicC family protein [Clostridium sp. D2Q-14]|uniref:YicC/YloC family endoribonuclease n=1 Tax=Anaeromonas gelatinilytica TaxID=2683194 RepID=UPI00193BE1A8|nr:YicC/YloC family endoribonuclease [Anaeromonas gelatinilytica]MBS4536118.1 YicC family protein [Anaeromonas gelatinilytica]
MIKSMTGFGRGENDDGIRKFTVEIKSVNHRYNDVIVRMPKHFSYLEENIKNRIKEKIKRGRVEVYINLENLQTSNLDVKVDMDLAKSYKNALELLNKELYLNTLVTLDQIIKYPDVINVEKEKDEEDVIWNVLSIALNQALENLYNMRIKEGKKLAEDIIKRSEYIESLVKEIEKKSPIVVEEYKEKLEDRIKSILDESVEIDDMKLANEVAYFADKSSITEEIVRLYSHIEQLINTLESKDSVGRKLDFIVQEMNREANTMGSKVGDIEITNNVVEIKSELEKIREQIQNIE